MITAKENTVYSTTPFRDKMTGKLRRKIRGDGCIVNCIAPHKYAPVMAISGIDSTVKLWQYQSGEGALAKARLDVDVSVDYVVWRLLILLIASTLPFITHRAYQDDDESDQEQHASNAGDSDSDEADESLHERMAAAQDIITSEEASARLAAAETDRQHGNDLFKAGDYPAALGVYSRILRSLAFHAPTEGAIVAHRQSTILILLNIAAAQLQIKDYHGARENCARILRMDPVNVKAMYRAAQAEIAQEHFADAERQIDDGLKVAPAEASLLKLKEQVEAKKKEAQDRERELFRRMFRSNK